MRKCALSLADLDYSLPRERIASRPAEQREASRLCVWNRGKIEHRVFSDIPAYFNEGDCLVLNDTRVIPARLSGRRKSGGRVEVFLLEKAGDREWIIMGSPGRALREGERIFFAEGLAGDVVALHGRNGKRRMRFSGDEKEIFRAGSVPLPPYIRREADESDRTRYQTVYAKHEGSVAAPTAGLHFTDSLLREIASRGVSIAYVTLHVGLGTFKPITENDVAAHVMEPEPYEISPAACEAIRAARARGARVVAAGTTTVRALESAALERFPLAPCRAETPLFITPPFEFRVTDALITNFHMPRSTLLLMVSAFAGHGNVMAVYREALEKGYRFLSYGDATFWMR